MQVMRFFWIGLALVTLSGCISPFLKGSGTQITEIVVMKEKRRIYLMNKEQVLHSFDIDLGFSPAGDKTVEGDGKTPEGSYVINRFNRNSQFHRSLGISYPNRSDKAQAKRLGKSPGGEIFIHGQPNSRRPKGDDWTAGCIAVSNPQIEYMFTHVKLGTPVTIYP